MSFVVEIPSIFTKSTQIPVRLGNTILSGNETIQGALQVNGSLTLNVGGNVDNTNAVYYDSLEVLNTLKVENSNMTDISANTITTNHLVVNTLNSSEIIIENTSPTLTIKNETNQGGRICFGDVNHGIGRGLNLSTLTNVNDVAIHTNNGGSIGFITSGLERMRVQTDGRIYIRTKSFIGNDLSNAFDIDANALGITDALGLRTTRDTNWILNIYNNSGPNRGKIRGINASTISFDTSSDRRKKMDITDLENGLEKVMKLKPRTYKWKVDSYMDDGFIAQEVFETLPNFIPLNRFKCDISQNDIYHGKLCSCCDIEHKSNGEDYMFGLDYGKFTPYLCKAIQEQQEMIETLKKNYNDLLSRVQALM